MKICILGNLLYIKEVMFMSNELKKKEKIVSTPTLYELENKSDIYPNALKEIKEADLVLLVYRNRSELDFIFYFGMVFALDKKYKLISTDSIKNLMISKGEINGNENR